jgi:hypothetical protein
MCFATTSGVSSNAALPPPAEMIVSSLSGNDKLTSDHDVLSDAAFHTGQRPPSSATRNLFILDWDDTIMPTYELKNKEFSIPDRSTEIALNIYGCCVKRSLEMMKQAGQVVIVTNSLSGWVEKSCQLFLPLVWPLVEDIPVAYARTDQTATDVHQLSKAKFVVFKDLVQKYHPTNIFSLGDGLYERNALWNLPGEGVLRKCLNFRPHPSVDQLFTQHVMVCRRLEEAIRRGQDVEWMLYDPAEM